MLLQLHEKFTLEFTNLGVVRRSYEPNYFKLRLEFISVALTRGMDLTKIFLAKKRWRDYTIYFNTFLASAQ